MSVYDNVAFGLKARKHSKEEIGRRVEDQLKAAGLWEMRETKVIDISGGQKQRTALARALVIKPSLLLLDEPLFCIGYQNASPHAKRAKGTNSPMWRAKHRRDA